MAKNKDQKRKERQKRVAQKKLQESVKRRELAKQKATDKAASRNVITAGVRHHSELNEAKAKQETRKM